jgi:hypothetical protein
MQPDGDGRTRKGPGKDLIHFDCRRGLCRHRTHLLSSSASRG